MYGKLCTSFQSVPRLKKPAAHRWFNIIIKLITETDTLRYLIERKFAVYGKQIFLKVAVQPLVIHGNAFPIVAGCKAIFPRKKIDIQGADAASFK